MEFFVVSPESIKYIHKLYNTNRKKIDEDIKILEEWLKQQPHFPPITKHNPHAYEVSLLDNKFNVEKAKARLEAHVTLRTVYRDIFQIITRDDRPLPSALSLRALPLPQQGPKFERLIFSWYQTGDSCSFEHYVQSVLVLLELGTRYEYSNGYRIICDCKNVSFNLVTTTDFINLRRLIVLMINGYTSRFLGLHIINAQPFVHIGLAAIKIVLKEKLSSRIILHDSLESLHEVVPQKYLPEEYGGNAGNLNELSAKYDAFIENHRDFLREADQFETNESLRIGKLADNDAFGVDGTFKKLELD